MTEHEPHARVWILRLVAAIVLGIFGIAGYYLVTIQHLRLPFQPPVCGIENCHGLDITCGPNPAEVCTTEYRLGDRCRQFAECRVVNKECSFSVTADFTECKACVEKCSADHTNDMVRMFECEAKCGN